MKGMDGGLRDLPSCRSLFEEASMPFIMQYEAKKKTTQQRRRETKRLLDKILPVVCFVSVVFLMYAYKSLVSSCVSTFSSLSLFLYSDWPTFWSRNTRERTREREPHNNKQQTNKAFSTRTTTFQITYSISAECIVL